MDLKNLLRENHIKIFTLLVFGDQESHLLDGKPVIDHVTRIFDLLVGAFKDPTYILTGGIPFKYKLTKGSQEIDELHKKLTNLFKKDYEKRFNSDRGASESEGKGVL